MEPRVNIVILNWNGYKDTSELFESLLKVKYRNFKIIIVDNHSVQNDLENLTLNYGDYAKIVSCEDNLGFAGGNNKGIKISLEENADYILLLNNDTTVEPDFLNVLVNKFQKEHRAGIVAPQINYYNKPDKIWSTGGRISIIRGSGFAKSNVSESKMIKKDRDVSFVSGCCMLIKTEVFREIGLFDEIFFLYIEDTDFCYRAKKAGYKIYVTPDSKVFHKVSNSTKKVLSALPLYYASRNRLYFAKKNFPNVYFFTLTYFFITMIFKGLIWVCKGKFRNIIAVENGISDFLKGSMGKTDHGQYNEMRNID